MYAARDKNFNTEMVYFFDKEPTPNKNGDFVNDCSMFRMEYDDLKKVGITIEPGQCKPVIMAAIVGQVVEGDVETYGGDSRLWIKDDCARIGSNPFNLQHHTKTTVKIFCPEQPDD